MRIKPYVEYEFDLSNTFSFGMIPENVLVDVFGNGRQSGVLLEYDIVERFINLDKEGCGQGAGEDIRFIDNDFVFKVQCKTVRLDRDGDIGWTTKSGLWDSKRGKKLQPDEWDNNHNSYFEHYDFFMYLDISTFAPVYRAMLIPTAELYHHSDIERQQTEYHFGKSGRSKIYCDPPDNWHYPIKVTSEMYSEWRNKSNG